MVITDEELPLFIPSAQIKYFVKNVSGDLDEIPAQWFITDIPSFKEPKTYNSSIIHCQNKV